MGGPNNTKAGFFRADADWVNDTLRVALFNDTIDYTFDPDNHEFVSDVLDGITAEEFGNSGGTGYSRQALTTKTVGQDDADDRGFFTAADQSWASLDGETIQGWIVYKQVGGDDSTPGDDPVLAVVNDPDTSDLPIPTNGSEIQINWHSDGIAEMV